MLPGLTGVVWHTTECTHAQLAGLTQQCSPPGKRPGSGLVMAIRRATPMENLPPPRKALLAKYADEVMPTASPRRRRPSTSYCRPRHSVSSHEPPEWSPSPHCQLCRHRSRHISVACSMSPNTGCGFAVLLPPSPRRIGHRPAPRATDPGRRRAGRVRAVEVI